MGTSPWPKRLQKQPQEDGLGLKTEMEISRGQKPSTKNPQGERWGLNPTLRG